MQPDTPVDAEHEETYIVAYADTCAESQFLKEIIEFELRAWTSFIVVECPHVACIEEDGTIKIAYKMRTILYVSLNFTSPVCSTYERVLRSDL